MTKVSLNKGNETKSDIILWGIFKSETISFFVKKLKYFNVFQIRNFSVLWLKRTQIMEMKINQTFFHGTYSNPTTYLSVSKNIKIFQKISKSIFLSFMTKVNPNNGIKTKSGIFPRDIFK